MPWGQVGHRTSSRGLRACAHAARIVEGTRQSLGSRVGGFGDRFLLGFAFEGRFPNAQRCGACRDQNAQANRPSGFPIRLTHVKSYRSRAQSPSGVAL